MYWILREFSVPILQYCPFQIMSLQNLSLSESQEFELPRLMDMSLAEIQAAPYLSLNLFTIYVLSKLAASQSMGLLASASKNAKSAHPVQKVSCLA